MPFVPAELQRTAQSERPSASSAKWQEMSQSTPRPYGGPLLVPSHSGAMRVLETSPTARGPTPRVRGDVQHQAVVRDLSAADLLAHCVRRAAEEGSVLSIVGT
jgi:hypothetical protein